MRHTFFAVSVVLLTVLVTFGACKKSSNANNPIVGTLRLVTIYDTTYGTPNQILDTNYGSLYIIEYTFRSNGTFSYTDTGSGTYSTALPGKLIQLSSGGSSTPDTSNCTLSGNVLTLSRSTSTTGFKGIYDRQ